jgi:hypothetical protein
MIVISSREVDPNQDRVHPSRVPTRIIRTTKTITTEIGVPTTTNIALTILTTPITLIATIITTTRTVTIQIIIHTLAVMVPTIIHILEVQATTRMELLIMTAPLIISAHPRIQLHSSRP